MHGKLAIVGLIQICWPVSAASAHYLWVVIDGESGGHGAARIYFEEGPAARDGRYLDHFTKTSRTQIRTIENIEPRLLRPEDVREKQKRWLQAPLPAGAPRSVECYGQFGVYNYGKTKVLLHYYARNLDVSTHDDLHELARAEEMELDLVPHDEAGGLELTVLWKGKPAAGRPVSVRGPQKFRENLRTDENGRVRLTTGGKGRYTFRTSVDVPTPGREGGEDYDLIRHHATLIMRLPLEE